MANYKILFCQGGLGDHLSLSTLPEEWTKQGYEVLLSYQNIHRNLEIHELVWKTNPYIKGYTPDSAYYITTEESLELNQERKLTNESFIESLERKYGIFNTGNKIPKLYRQHNLITELEGKTILNFQSITQPYESGYVLDKLDQLIKELNIQEEDIFELEIEADVNTFKDRFFNLHESQSITTNFNKYKITNIFQHCDVIYSCKNYITLHSGGAVLASAINNSNTFVIMNESIRNVYDTKTFIFPNQKYIF